MTKYILECSGGALVVRGPEGFELPKNETKPDPMHFDIEVI